MSTISPIAIREVPNESACCAAAPVAESKADAGHDGSREFFRVIDKERLALEAVAHCLGGQPGRVEEMCRAIASAESGSGRRRICLSGVGKAGLIARKVAATLVSTGTNAFFLHPVEALHGDLGLVQSHDAALLFSYSGETAEVLKLARQIKARGCSILSITRAADSSLGGMSDTCLELGDLEEACFLGLAPTSSTVAMLAVGDALAIAAAKMRGFGSHDFGRNHPAGALGLQFLAVRSVMRTGERLVGIARTAAVREVVERVSRAKTGAAIIWSDDRRLVGIVTDGDLRRAFLTGEGCLDRPAAEFGTIPCRSISASASIADAVKMFGQFRIEDLPVVDGDTGEVVGLLCLKDCAAL